LIADFTILISVYLDSDTHNAIKAVVTATGLVTYYAVIILYF